MITNRLIRHAPHAGTHRSRKAGNMLCTLLCHLPLYCCRLDLGLLEALRVEYGDADGERLFFEPFVADMMLQPGGSAAMIAERIM